MTVKQLGLRAGCGLGGALALGAASALGLYLDADRELLWLWVPLLLGALPALAWGAWHLALYRGYRGSVGGGLCLFGCLAAGLLGTRRFDPPVLAVGTLFMVLLPTVTLFAMRDKNPRHRRRRHRHTHHPPHEHP